ncbi:FAD-binding oxidoreductase [Zymomonas mobilis]|uniref:FAD-binding oxidoreductase n=1 Tax=Zymomonas mobilis TaxID=542 RepID=UPI0039E72C05
MSRQPEKALLDALKALLGPKGFTQDPVVMAPYLEDWRGKLKGEAAALLSPASTQEVVAIMKMASEAKVAVVPQGGNSSTVGGATPSKDGAALLLSTKRLNAIRAISPEESCATVEAGVILSALHEAADKHNLRFPLNIASKDMATIGGLISTNAGGSHVLRFGQMRASVLGIEVVFPDGSLLENLRPLRKDNQGYDLRQLLAGAEGSLGVITAASLRLIPKPHSKIVIWVGVESPSAALALLRHLEKESGEAVEVFELMESSLIELVLKHIPDTEIPTEKAYPWYVLIEATAFSEDFDLEALMVNILADATEKKEILEAIIAQNETQAGKLWRLRETIPLAERSEGFAVKHDISVPVSAMPSFIEQESRAIQEKFPGTTVLAFGHLGDGNVHFNVCPPKEVTDQLGWVENEGIAVSHFVYERVMANGGAISAEHGIGQTKLADFMRFGNKTKIQALKAIKKAIDPQSIMNPGKLLPAEQAE